MLWITLETGEELEYLDAINFIIKEGLFFIMPMHGEIRTGKVSEIIFIHVEAVSKD